MTYEQSSKDNRLAKEDMIEKIEEGMREAKTGNVMTIEETTKYLKKELADER